MSMRRGWVMLGAFLGLVGCQGAQDEEHGGYLVLDRDARVAGFELQGVAMDASRVLPVEVDPGAEVTLVGPTGQVAISAEADQLIVVRGVWGTVEKMSLGGEADPDRLVVRGSEEAVRELSDVLAGEVTSLGQGAWEVHAENALGEASRVRAPSGLVEVLPGLIVGAGLPQAPGEKMVSGQLEAASPPSPEARTARGFDGRQMIILADALMPKAVSCADPVTGVWVSHQYHHGEWYVFTVKIRRAWAGSSNLVADIRSEFWEGGPEDMHVPACNAADAYHGAVTMTGRGFVSGGQVTLNGTSWKVAKTACDHDWSGSYLLDNFTGTLDGSSFHAVNNDGGRSIDDATEFRRVQCQ